MSYTQNFTLQAAVPGIVHYGTVAPTSIATTFGSVSPLGWTIGFFDDFTSWTQSTTSDLASTDATTKWYCLVDNSKFLLNPGLEQEFYCNPFRTPGCNPFSHNGSVLTITASNPTTTQLNTIKANTSFNQTNYNTIGGPYISGAFHSGQVYKATYGYYEINCRQPAGPGTWTAFWFPNGVVGEIDMMEQSGASGTAIGTGVHYNGTDGIGGATQYQVTNQSNAVTDFNTYGTLWCPNYVGFYYNGRLVKSCSPPYTGAIGGATPQMIMNFALGNGNGAGLATPSNLPMTWDIDWIRVSVIGPA